MKRIIALSSLALLLSACGAQTRVAVAAASAQQIRGIRAVAFDHLGMY